MRALFIACLLPLLGAASVAHADTVICSKVVKYAPSRFSPVPLDLKRPDRSRLPQASLFTDDAWGMWDGEVQPPLALPRVRLSWGEAPLGTWEGEVQLSRSRLCIGFLIEGIDDNGEFGVTYAYNSETHAPVEIVGISKSGVSTSKSGRYYNGFLTWSGSEPVSFEFTKISDDTLKGYLIEGSTRYDARVRRQGIMRWRAD